jgi:phytoene synthase
VNSDKSYKKSNFGAAFIFLSKDKRAALSSIYSFCRFADDAVDDYTQNAPELLQNLRDELDRIFNGVPQTELGRDLKSVISEFPIPKQYFADVIDGVSRDLKTPVRFGTFDDLKWYMKRVAGAVGLMCVEIFGYKNETSKIYAKELGYAVQLTNILRDIAEDAKLNRVYIPRQILERFGVCESDVLNLRNCAKLKALLSFMAELAENYYLNAKKILPREDLRSLMAARAMGNIYFRLLRKIKKSDYKITDTKIRVGAAEKFFIILKTLTEKI